MLTMTGSKSDLRLALWASPAALYLYTSQGLPLDRFLVSSSQASQPKPLSASRFTTRLRASLLRCVWGIWLAVSLTYATCGLLGEFMYAEGWTNTNVPQAIGELRRVGEIFPLERRYRQASASLISNIAIQNDDPQWKAAAIPELRVALSKDKTSADLLAMLLAFEMSDGQFDQGKRDFALYKRIARNSPLVGMIENADR